MINNRSLTVDNTSSGCSGTWYPYLASFPFREACSCVYDSASSRGKNPDSETPICSDKLDALVVYQVIWTWSQNEYTSNHAVFYSYHSIIFAIIAFHGDCNNLFIKLPLTTSIFSLFSLSWALVMRKWLRILAAQMWKVNSFPLLNKLSSSRGRQSVSQADVYPLDAQFFIAWSPFIISLNTLRRNNITQKLLTSLTFDVATDCFIDAIDAKHQLTESVIHTLRLPEKIGDKWKDLARKLGYIESVVNAIQTEENNIPKECCITVLVRWMEREAEGATVERLAQVLREIELKNLSRLLKGRRPWKGIRQFII